jgi:hypothetical protein
MLPSYSLYVIPIGLAPVEIVLTTSFVVPFITDTVSEPVFATYK